MTHTELKTPVNLEQWARNRDGSTRHVWSLLVWWNEVWKLLCTAPLTDPKQPWWLPALFLFFPSSFLWEIVHQVRLLSFAMDRCREPHAFLIKLPAQQPCCRRNKYARNRKQVVVYLWPFKHAFSSVECKAEHSQCLEVPGLFFL